MALIEPSEKPVDAATQHPPTYMGCKWQPEKPTDAQHLADLLAERLGRQSGIVLVDRETLQRVLKEKKLDASFGSRAALGRLVGAEFLIACRVYEAGDRQFVTASIIEVASGSTTEATVSGPKHDIDGLIAPLAVKIARRLVEAARHEKNEEGTGPIKRGGAGAANYLDRTASGPFLAEVKAKLASRRIPAIAVAVAEEHYWAKDDRTVDRPEKTAQAELTRMLRDCGLSVKELPADVAKKLAAGGPIDWSSGLAGIDWIIVGKSHSRFSQRMGELVDCVAEIDVTLSCRPGTGKLAAAARSCYGSDLNEALAATQAHGEAAQAAGLALLRQIAAVPENEPPAPPRPGQDRAEVRRTVFAVRFDNQTGFEQYDPAAAGAADLIAGMLGQQPSIRTVERQRLLSLTAEQALTLSGLTGPRYDCAVRPIVAGRHAALRPAVPGRRQTDADAKTVDLASQRVLASEQVSGREEDLLELSLQLVRGLSKQMSLPQPSIELAAIDRSPLASLHFGKGLCHYYAGDMDSALMQLMRTLELDPDYIDAYYFAGKCYITLGEPAHAVIEWEKLLNRSGDHPKAAEIRQALPKLRQEAEASGTRPLVPDAVKPTEKSPEPGSQGGAK